MNIGEARALAREWVVAHMAARPGFRGAYLSGSAAASAPEDPLARDSDVDVRVVWEGSASPDFGFGKRIYRGSVLDVSHMNEGDLASPERVLTDYHLAHPFGTRGPILADPAGLIGRLQEAIAPRFDERFWVAQRVAHALSTVERHLDALDGTGSWPTEVMAWLFATGVTAHVILVAALQNPTVRRRYVALNGVLEGLGLGRHHGEFLALLGSDAWTPDQALRHLGALTWVFDQTARLPRPPFPFSADISPWGRPMAIDGSRGLIRQGFHRESAFWMLVTFARCQQILESSEEIGLRRRAASGFREILADIGITDRTDLVSRAVQVRRFRPALEGLADGVMIRRASAGRRPRGPTST